MRIKFKKTSEYAIQPTYANFGDAGADLVACEKVLIHGRTQKLIDTGIGLEIPEGYFGLVRPRSGLATKHGIGMNSSGVIDSGYRGSIGVNLINHLDESYTVNIGDKIAQIVFLPYAQADFIWTEELDSSERGSNGYGSTGW